MTINGKVINQHSPSYLIAEMSANHSGSFEKAIEIIHAAKRSGADAIKLQTYRADTITLDCNNEDFTLPADNPWEAHQTLYALYEKAFTPWEWHKALFDEAKKIGIDIFSAPFDISAVDFLETLDCPVYKIASPEITDIGLIKRVAQTSKPVILSTGLAELEDIELAIKTLTDNGCQEYALLKCTTAYPAPAEDINLLTIPDMAKRFQCIAGLSDHSLGNSVPIAAVTLGAKVIEKHFVLDKEDPSVDAFFSLDPDEFSQMVQDIRFVEQALGGISYEISPASQKNMLARRSLYVSDNINAGEIITSKNIKSVRPSYGLAPKYYEHILGKKVTKSLAKGDRLSLDDIEL
ncbi:pseudaminic acid synthase [Colwellia sp. D2M02]|nr:pseudaminic acid synthase [Colwellia sp. D2M02]